MSHGPVDLTRGPRRTREARDRDRAAPFPAERIEAELDRLGWAVVCVRPGREFAAVDWWAGRGVFSWTPVVTVYRRANRAAKAKHLRSFAAAPGYVVAGLDPVFPRWASVFGCPDALGVLGPDGRPQMIGTAAVRAIMRLTWTAPEAQRRMPSRGEYGVGDRVRVRGGGLDGVETVVVGIEGDEARIVAEILGAAREVRIGVDRLVRAA